MKIILKTLFFFGFITIIPIVFLSMIIILIEDGRPSIFKQNRVGKNMRHIKIYKIRTMKKDTPNRGTHEIHNSNLLKFGSIIRTLKIDELPQILNFLRGDINIIGPRPCLPNQFDLIKERDSLKLYSIKPGITGLAQVLGYDMSNPKTLAYIDQLYLKNKSLKLDLTIFFATFFKKFRKILENSFEEDIKNITSNKYV